MCGGAARGWPAGCPTQATSLTVSGVRDKFLRQHDNHNTYDHGDDGDDADDADDNDNYDNATDDNNDDGSF